MRAKLQQLREANGYTQQTFSAAVGTSRSHYSQIETGDKQPALRLALRIKRVPGETAGTARTLSSCLSSAATSFTDRRWKL